MSQEKKPPPCKTCPWRKDSGVVYDEDGLEAYLEGYEPSCHCLVGLQSVFHNQPPLPGQECRGPDFYESGDPAYHNPIEEGSTP